MLPCVFKGALFSNFADFSAPRPLLFRRSLHQLSFPAAFAPPRGHVVQQIDQCWEPSSPVDACFILLSPHPRVPQNQFSLFFSVCVCLCGSQVLPCIVHPLHQPLLSSPPPRPPSPPANESQRRLLGNGVAQPTPDSDSEEEFVPNSFLVKSGSASLGVAANGKSLFLPNFCVFPPFVGDAD